MAQISSATLRNFQKLNKDLNSHEFTSRANKRDSVKKIIPTEYYSNKANIEVINNIIQIIKKYDRNIAINSLIVAFLLAKKIVFKQGKIISSPYSFVTTFINTLDFDENLLQIQIPLTEKDPLGLIYQQLITEGEKNKKGSYYTPAKIVKELISVSPTQNQTFCDPCCGTGGFLMEAVEHFSPDKVFGFDLDPFAIKIAKANLFARNPEINYNQNLQCKNFLQEPLHQFDYIISNPPWGSLNNGDSLPCKTCISSSESFSYFIERALQSVSSEGLVNFLLPISILNVKLHKDIRDFILANNTIQQIKTFGKCFKGVLTDVISLEISRKKTDPDYSYKVSISGKSSFYCSIQNVFSHKNHNISLLDQTDTAIIKKIESKAVYNLKNADFALGIVTGNNSKLLKQSPAPELRPIITGKDVHKYYLQAPANFIRYQRQNFQQICPDTFFQAESKFLYKFISKRLVFALDQNRNLALNSANIMILPHNFPLDKYVVLALLNSGFMNFYFIKTTNQVKVLKDDLQNLPLPALTETEQKEIKKLVLQCLQNQPLNYDLIENFFFNLYGFTQSEIDRIKETITT